METFNPQTLKTKKQTQKNKPKKLTYSLLEIKKVVITNDWKDPKDLSFIFYREYSCYSRYYMQLHSLVEEVGTAYKMRDWLNACKTRTTLKHRL